MSNLPPCYYSLPMLDFKTQNIGLTNFYITEFLDSSKRPLIKIKIHDPNDFSKYLQGNALLDTGATFSCIHFTEANVLNLNKISEKESNFIQFTSLKGEYEANVTLFDTLIPFPIKLLLMPIKSDVKMIIGTDILSNFILEYNFPEGKFTLKSK
jgi:hypothetical protein